MSVTAQAITGHKVRTEDQDIRDEGDAPRQWMVWGVAVVTAKDRQEATDKAKAGQLDQPWEALDDVGGFYEPEPHEDGAAIAKVEGRS